MTTLLILRGEVPNGQRTGNLLPRAWRCGCRVMHVLYNCSSSSSFHNLIDPISIEIWITVGFSSYYF
jgi:hypothetical protein